jgi:dTDP-4-dehydrorhamnose reductase
MHVLLTGASGFLGSLCCDLLSQQAHVRLSILRSGHRSSVPAYAAPQFNGSTTKTGNDLIKLIGNAHPTHILHIGALSSPDGCERQPEQAYVANVAFTRMLAEYAALIGAHLTTVSTDLVFDGSKAPDGGFCEKDPPNPHSVYGKTKWTAEQVALTAPSNAVVRLSLLYGYAASDSTGVLGWMERSFSEQKPLSLFEDEFRTPLDVRDAAEALVRVSFQRLSGVWHCGGPTRLSRVEFGIQVARARHYDERLITPASRLLHAATPARPEDVSLNSRKLWSKLNWAPHSVHEALSRYPRGQCKQISDL